jgi:hypothetical protein
MNILIQLTLLALCLPLIVLGLMLTMTIFVCTLPLTWPLLFWVLYNMWRDWDLVQAKWRFWASEWYARWFSKLVECVSPCVEVDHRQMFRNIHLRPVVDNRSQHSHPTAAAVRTVMNDAINHYVRSCDANCYSVSMSAADERAGLSGNRYFRTSKDTAYAYRHDCLLSSDIVKMSDTSYYCELPQYLDGHEVILYEISPFRACGSALDATYEFTATNMIVEQVNGGARYQHTLWDFESDNFWVPTIFGAWEYLVEKIVHPTYPEYRIIGLFPRRFVYTPFSWFMVGPALRKRKVVQGEFVVVRSQRSDDADYGRDYISIAKLGQPAEALIPVEVAVALAIRKTTAKSFDMGSVEMYLEHELKDKRWTWWKENIGSLKTVASVFVDFLNHQPTFFTDGKDFISFGAQPRAYTPINKEYRPLASDAKPTMRNVTPDGHEPLVDGAVAPTAGRPTELAAVEERVTKVRNEVDPPQKYHGYSEEFIRFLIPDEKVGAGCPVDPDELEERMPRPTQRALTQQSRDWLDCQKQLNKSFIKHEAYGSIAAPRMISTLPPSFKMRYALFLYSFVDTVLHGMQWYAFGHDPNHLAQLVSNVATTAQFVVPTDFSKFDGTISKFIRNLERRMLSRWVTARYRDELLRLHAEQSRMAGVTTNGIWVLLGFHRLSGSSETSGFNSTDNAYIAYSALRNCGHSPRAAWQRLGLYGGDDGLTADIDPRVYIQTAKDLGLTLKASVVNRGDVIPFLGRHWYTAWAGLATSTCDIDRQLRKLHLTANKQGSLREVCVDKALGFRMCDRDTPIIGQWAERVLEIAGVHDAEPRGPDCSWFSQQGAQFQQPPSDLVLAFISGSGYPPDTVERLCNVIRSAKTIEELFPRPNIGTKPALECKLDAIVDGDVVRVGGGNGVPDTAGTGRGTVHDDERVVPARRPTSNESRHANVRGPQQRSRGSGVGTRASARNIVARKNSSH